MIRAAAAASLATAFLCGCGGTLPPPEPVVGPTGYVYPLGTPPTETRFSQTSALYFRADNFERALELALEGLADDPQNPIHHFLAGLAYLRLGDFDAANDVFVEAQRIYPAYELDIEPQREAAWGEEFNGGLAAYAEGDVRRTIELWTGATAVYDLRPDAHRNLAGLLATEGRFDEAVDVYRAAITGLERQPATRVLTEEEVASRRNASVELEDQLSDLLVLTERHGEAVPLLRRRLEREPESVQVRGSLASSLSALGRNSEAREIYSGLLSEGGLQATELFNLGVGLFRAEDFPGAGEAFRRLTELQPDSRDAWYNYANALFAMEDWGALVGVGQRLLELDPLGESALLIAARAQLESGDRDAAVAILERVDAAPVHVESLRFRRAGSDVLVEGRVTGNTAVTGSPIELLFSFFGDAGVRLGQATAKIDAPPSGETEGFVITFAGPASSYRYEVVRLATPGS